MMTCKNFQTLSVVFGAFCYSGISILSPAIAQIDERTEKEERDSLYIVEVENRPGPDKVLHAEPLYIDLIRDLGARKGEKELNLGLGLTDRVDYDEYLVFIEYEWAPVNRLGLEVELPFTFYSRNNGNNLSPGNRLNSLKVAAQHSFFVSEKKKTTLAWGYLHEFIFPAFNIYGKRPFFKGNLFNPFIVGAKRWGNNLHTLIYTGPVFHQYFNRTPAPWEWHVNSNLHYMIPGTRNFIGLEMNKQVEALRSFNMVFRPQMRLGIADNMLVGIVAGIPLQRGRDRISTFLRLIYEPGFRKGHHG
jgi:hypothetical protein